MSLNPRTGQVTQGGTMTWEVIAITCRGVGTNMIRRSPDTIHVHVGNDLGQEFMFPVPRYDAHRWHVGQTVRITAEPMEPE